MYFLMIFPMPKNSPKESECVSATIGIAGMHCQSCELLLERKLKMVSGVLAVEVDYRSGSATLSANPDNLPSLEKMEVVIRKAGYRMLDEVPVHTSGIFADQKRWMEIGGALLVIFALYNILQVFDLISLVPATTGAVTLGGTFLIGLVAGTSSCLAVTGGLLLSVAAKYNEVHESQSSWQKFQPLLHFNIGRLASYLLLGGIVGWLGQSIALGTRMTGMLNIIVAFVMLYLALTILQIIPRGSCPIRPPKALSHWIADLSEEQNPLAPFALGALTFFLPCGFTQSLQLAALASGSFLSGALMMFTFALGTLPALLGLSLISSHAKGMFSHLFLRFSGALVLVLAIFNLNGGLLLMGINAPGVIASAFTIDSQGELPLPVVQGGAQEVAMRIAPYGYDPASFTVKAGVPVRLTIDGTGARGCMSQFVIPSLSIRQPLSPGPNVIVFTPPSPGFLSFSCAMGMMGGLINVI